MIQWDITQWGLIQWDMIQRGIQWPQDTVQWDMR